MSHLFFVMMVFKTMTLLSTYRIDVLESFKALKQALSTLETILDADQHLPAWFEPPTDLPISSQWNLRKQAMAMIRQLEYLDNQNPREILVGAGLFAASEQTLQTIEHLNQCKDRFKAAMLALKQANIKINDSLLGEHFETLLDKRPENIAQTLKKVGLARLHLKQCYRRIPIFLERPSKVSWTWANTRAITRISKDEAKALLLKQGKDYGIEQQLQKLEIISAHEPLAIVQELAPHLRANLVFSCQKKNEESKNEVCDHRIMVKGPIPLFYRAETNAAFPRIRPPGPKRGKNIERRTRADVKLNPEPFLPAIRVHRYTV